MLDKPKQPVLSIIIPARNEAGNIASVINDIQKLTDLPKKIIFVEGHSTDHTWQEIQNHVQRSPLELPITAVQQTGQGKTDAVRLGFKQVEEGPVAIFDADNTVPAKYLRTAYHAHCDNQGGLIVGNRFAHSMEKEAMRPLNKVGNKLFAILLSWVLGTKIPDTLCGLKLCAKADYIQWQKWVQRELGDFDPFGDFELLFPAAALGAGIYTIPVHYRARRYGTTQIRRFRDGLRLFYLTYLGFVFIKRRQHGH